MDYAVATMNRGEVRRNILLSQVYAWMTAGLLVTGAIAAFTAQSAAIRDFVLGNSIVFWGLLIVELVLVVALSATAARLSAGTATALFLLYAALNGLTLSAIFLVYTGASLASTFFITAGTFAAMSLYGYTTKRDLTGIGHIALMALIGIILATVVNLFVQNAAIYWIVTYVGVIVFVGLTAADTQKIKRLLAQADETNVGGAAILGALRLYLDFLNLFLFLLRLSGRRSGE